MSESKKLPPRSLRSDVFSAIALLSGGKSSTRLLDVRTKAVSRVHTAIQTADGAREVSAILEALKKREQENQDFWENKSRGIRKIEGMIANASARVEANKAERA